MRKNIIIFGSLVLIFLILYGSIVKTVFQTQLQIKAAVSVIHREISMPEKIARWYLPYATADTTNNKLVINNEIDFNNATLKVDKVIGYSATYKVSEGEASNDILFEVMPDTANYSIVKLFFKTSLFNKIFNTNKIVANAKKSLENLKDYLSDNKKMYGFDIDLSSVTDTAFLFSSKVVSKGSRKTAFKELFESLISEAKTRDLGYNGVRIFYMLPYGKDSLHIFTSIGILNAEKAPLEGNFKLKKMPFMGKLLKSYYQGTFANSNAPLDALSQFKTDNGMNSMAIPFMKLISDGVSFDDNQIIQANALYPVY